MAWIDAVRERRAQRFVARLVDRHAAGLAAVAAAPGLAAVVDQHAAAVRDILLMGVEGAAVTSGVVLLAAYARGLLDEVGSRPLAPEHREWITARLLAVCALSRSWTGRAADRPAPQLPDLG